VQRVTYQSTGRGAWAEPTVEEVAPGVHRIPLPLPNDGLRAVNVYVLTGRETVVAIDSGWSIDEARDLLVGQLRTLDIGPADIRRFLVTHVHRDHYTLAVALRREFGNRIELGYAEKPSIDHANAPVYDPLGPQLRALRVLGAGELADRFLARFAADPPTRERDFEPPDGWLSNGVIETEVGRTLEVVETPGHTQGHVVFHDRANGLLFAGDHVLPTITPSIGFEGVVSPNPLGQFLDSLALIRSRPDARLLAAHGPVAESAHARVDELVEHHGRRLDATLGTLEQGATTGRESAGILTWTRRETAFADLDDFNAMLAITETGAHLQLLLAQGRVSTEDSDGVRHYRLG
jgi:glyoxylase-like metal-dependent hydrolase (beta-lactamase superfamily II)